MAKVPAPNNRARVPHSIALWAVEWGNHLDARGCPVQAPLGRGFSFAVAMSEGNDKCRDLGASPTFTSQRRNLAIYSASMESTDVRDYATEAIKFWEPYRLLYNLALAAIVIVRLMP